MWGKRYIPREKLFLVINLQLFILFLSYVVKVNSVNIAETKTNEILDKPSVRDLPMVAALSSSNNSSNGNGSSKPCNATSLDECWSKLPPLNEPGIPSSPQAVDSACRAFDAGMACVDLWSRQCLGNKSRAQVKASVRGAHETFTFLCKDQKFRAEFLSHAVCYKKISSHWDECARRFIESLKKLGEHPEPKAICCIRLLFLSCVTEVAHRHCTQDAAKFLQRMAETLVRSTMRSHLPPECVGVTIHNCSHTNSCPSLKPSNFFFDIFHGVINFLPIPKATSSTQVLSKIAYLPTLFYDKMMSYLVISFKQFISPFLDNNIFFFLE